MKLLSRIFSRKEKATEGAYRPGPYEIDGGWLSAKAGKYWNWWQMGYSPEPFGASSAMVEACVSAYSQTAAMCPGDHWRTQEDGGRTRVTNSALARILRKPNDYQTISDFLLNLTRTLYECGESFAYAVRNEKGEILELHLMANGMPLVGVDGSIFYSLAGNEIAERRLNFDIPVPARDVMHVRLHTRRGYPLKGLSPILATVLERAMAGASLNQQVAFYLNQARPSFSLETDQILTLPQIKELREAWEMQTKGDNAGGTPVLSSGLKAKQFEFKAQDMQLAELLKMTEQNVALAFRLPLAVLGIGSTPFASTESLMSSWKASGLGFCLNHIEEAFGQLFRLKGVPDEYVEFDTSALMRSSFKERIEALSNGTRRLFTINEARQLEGLPSVDGGNVIRVQQQDVPLDWHEKNPPAAPAAPANEQDGEEGEEQVDDGADGEKAFHGYLDDERSATRH